MGNPQLSESDPGPDDELLERLRTLGDDYEPDVAAILRRVFSHRPVHDETSAG